MSYLFHIPKTVFSAIKILLLLLVGLALLQFSPLGTSDRSDKYAQDLFNHYLGDWVYPATHQYDSLVLLLNDEVVERQLGGRWPAPYGFHGRVLDTLLLHEPASVFIDFLWMDRDKPGVGYLKRVLEKYQARGIPIYMAATSSQAFHQSWPELAGLVIPVSAKIGFDPSDFVARQYPFRAGELESAALSMARTVRPDLEAIDGASSMDIFWGTRENRINASWMDPPRQDEAGLADALTSGFTQLNQRLPYSTTFFVRDLLNPVAETETLAAQQSRELVSGRHVFYGANLLGVQDLVFSSTRDILPGVYYHAMAFDNLLTWGNAYKSESPRLGEQRLAVPKWLLDLAVLLPVVAWGVHKYGSQSGAREEKPSAKAITLPGNRLAWPEIVKNISLGSGLYVGKWLFGFVVLVGWVGLCSWVEFRYFNVSAASWLGYLGVISLGFATEKLDLLDRLCHWLKTKCYQNQGENNDKGTQVFDGVCDDPAAIDTERRSVGTVGD